MVTFWREVFVGEEWREGGSGCLIGVDILNDIDGHVLANLGEQAAKAVAFAGIEAGGRLVDDDQPEVADEGPGDAEWTG